MKLFLISDNTDTLMGMRLAGIEGVSAATAEETESAIQAAVSDPDIGILLITAKLALLCPDLVHDRKLNYKRPLVVEIPDRDGGESIVSALERYIGEAVGIRL
jgi:V/A-type H+-transporting ATPase subunit F